MTREDFNVWAKQRGLTAEQARAFYKVQAKIEGERLAAARMAKAAIRDFGDPEFVRQLEDEAAKS